MGQRKIGRERKDVAGGATDSGATASRQRSGGRVMERWATGRDGRWETGRRGDKRWWAGAERRAEEKRRAARKIKPVVTTTFKGVKGEKGG